MERKFKPIRLVSRDNKSIGEEEVSVVMISVPQPEEASRWDLKAIKMEPIARLGKSTVVPQHIHQGIGTSL